MPMPVPESVSAALSRTDLHICPDCKGVPLPGRCGRCNSWRVVDGSGSALTTDNIAPEAGDTQLVLALMERAYNDSDDDYKCPHGKPENDPCSECDADLARTKRLMGIGASACPLCSFYGNHAAGCLIGDLREEVQRLNEEVIWPAVDHQHDLDCPRDECTLCAQLDLWAKTTGWQTPDGKRYEQKPEGAA